MNPRPPDPSHDPFVMLAREEKSRRPQRIASLVDQAKREYAEMLARMDSERQAARRRGRPAKAPFIASRSTDLADHLPKFTHRHASDRR